MENNVRDCKLNYDDVSIIPDYISGISSRSECNPYDEDGYLPIFASCMSSVVSLENLSDFNKSKIRTVLPRTYTIGERLSTCLNNQQTFVSFSLSEAEKYFAEQDIFKFMEIELGWFVEEKLKLKICIDLANGHMGKLIDLIKKIKEKYGDRVIIMSGNIANPSTYAWYEAAGCDYVRLGIGGGSCCLSSSNTGIHFPYFSLLKETYEQKKATNGKCKIIADGNIRGYRDIQKALVYADYVMIGGLFNKTMESAGKTTYGKSYFNVNGYKIFRPIKTLLTYGREIQRNNFTNIYTNYVKKGKLEVWKEMFGMSTKKAQSQINTANSITNKLKTSEGIVKHQMVEFDLKGWAENETDYLKSAMSYTNSKTLEEYKDSQWVRITNIRYNN